MQLPYSEKLNTASLARIFDNKSTSKFISLILRHHPEVIGITLDEHGWVVVDDLIKGVNKTLPLDMESFERIVVQDEKQRYSFNEDKTLIRANQGIRFQSIQNCLK